MPSSSRQVIANAFYGLSTRDTNTMNRPNPHGDYASENNVWKQRPTEIKTPSHTPPQPPKPKQVGNPYSRIRGHKTFNPTAGKNITNGIATTSRHFAKTEDPPTKRRRTDAFGLATSRIPNFSSRTNSYGRTPRQSHSKQATENCEQIVLSDDEDTGTPVASLHRTPSRSDPIDLLGASTSSSSTHNDHDMHPFHVMSSPASEKLIPPEDGESTKRMREKLRLRDSKTSIGNGKSHEILSVRDDDDDDDIEEFEPSPSARITPLERRRSPGLNSIREKTVQMSVQRIEESAGSSMRGHPHLHDVKVLSKTKGSVVSSMKGKEKTGPHRSAPVPLSRVPTTTASMSTAFYPQSDAATSSTPYQLKLPLKQLIIGENVFNTTSSDEPRLEWLATGEALYFKWRGGDKTIDIDDLVANTVTHTSVQILELSHFLQFQVLGRRPKPHYWETEQSEPELVTMEFSINSQEQSKSYRRLIHELTSSLRKREWSADVQREEFTIKAMLEMARNNAEAMREKMRRPSPEVPLPASMQDRNSEKKRSKPLRPAPTRTMTTRRAAKRVDYADISEDDSAVSSRNPDRSARPSRAQSLNPEEVILVYPPNGPGAVHITNGDEWRLDPGEFLNDTLIELGLKFWFNDLKAKSPELAEEVHIFNSFFYKKLNTKDVDEGYLSVRKWTAKIDIFKKKYIIIPINENAHWYLAIICHPGFILEPQQQPSSPHTRASQRISLAGKENADSDQSVNVLSEAAAVSSSNSEIISGTPIPEDEEMQEVIESTRSCSIVGDLPEPSDFGKVEGGGPSTNLEEDDRVLATDGEEDPGSLSPLPSDDEEIDQLADDDEEGLEYPQQSVVSDDDATEPGEPTMDVDTGKEGTSFPNETTSMDADMDASCDDHDQSRDAVAPDSFYGSSAGAAKRPVKQYGNGKRARSSSLSDVENEVSVEPNTSAEADSEVFDQQTCIFTFDSLGGQHPRVFKLLRNYLRLEAKDKKGIEVTSEAIAKLAPVPAQPNYCDCGLYLLHFVKTFMNDPTKYIRLILKRGLSKDRNEAWLADSVKNMREEMRQRILEESARWKAEKDKEKKERGANDASKAIGEGTADVNPADDSDSDIVVGEVVKTAPVKPPGRGRKSTGPQTAAAARLRG